jgi:hypothetical protein
LQNSLILDLNQEPIRIEHAKYKSLITKTQAMTKSSLIKTLLLSPVDGWQAIHQANLSIPECYIKHVVPLALITPVCGFIGATQVGWPVSGADTLFMTPASAFRIAILSFLAILVSVMVIGKLIQWMGQTYETQQPLARCVSLAAYTITPLLLIGVATLYPPPWFIYLIGLPALGYSVYLLYSGVPVMMEISTERGFLFSSAILTVGLIALVGLIVVTVGMWSFGLGPGFGH